MDPVATVSNPMDLERVLNDETAEARYVRMSLLESITDNFSNHKEIGRGGFGVVYKGQLQHGIVAVKHLIQTVGVHEERFLQEVDCLMRAKHKNIVRFLGYCSDIQQKMGKVEGKSVLLEEHKRFLCFEYLPRSLDKYIEDPPGGHGWKTCYQIIKGICEGLHYLHQQNIVHLDLKPANIMLDHNLVPKIADFGISKRFDEEQTHLIMTSNICGSLEYMAPEFFRSKIITFKSDVYSLGVIIVEILTGKKGYPDNDSDIDRVLEFWSTKFGRSPGDTKVEPARVCAKIGMECIALNPARGPDIGQILERFYEMESIYGASEIVDEVEPLLVSETLMGLEGTSTEASSSVSVLADKVSSIDVAAETSTLVSSSPHGNRDTSPSKKTQQTQNTSSTRPRARARTAATTPTATTSAKRAGACCASSSPLPSSRLSCTSCPAPRTHCSICSSSDWDRSNDRHAD